MMGIDKLMCLICRRIWPRVEQTPLIANGEIDLLKAQEKYPFNNLKMVFPRIADEGIDLLTLLLAYDPEKRLSVRNV